LIKSLRVGLTPEDIRKARAIEDRLYDEIWALSDYNLLPQLAHFRTPTLVIHGDYDLVPIECANHIAQAIPGARLVVLQNCGHFSYLESPDEIRKEISDLLLGASRHFS
jgi:proline iminopeptidase